MLSNGVRRRLGILLASWLIPRACARSPNFCRKINWKGRFLLHPVPRSLCRELQLNPNCFHQVMLQGGLFVSPSLSNLPLFCAKSEYPLLGNHNCSFPLEDFGVGLFVSSFQLICSYSQVLSMRGCWDITWWLICRAQTSWNFWKDAVSDSIMTVNKSQGQTLRVWFMYTCNLVMDSYMLLYLYLAQLICGSCLCILYCPENNKQNY